MGDILKIYFLVGFVVIGIEWAILIYGRGKLLESEKTDEKIAETLAFFIEVLIWPYQLFQAILGFVKLHKGNLTEEEWELYKEGYEQGLEIRKRRYERNAGRKKNGPGKDPGMVEPDA